MATPAPETEVPKKNPLLGCHRHNSALHLKPSTEMLRCPHLHPPVQLCVCVRAHMRVNVLPQRNLAETQEFTLQDYPCQESTGEIPSPEDHLSFRVGGWRVMPR